MTAVRNPLRGLAEKPSGPVSHPGLELSRWIAEPLGGDNAALRATLQRVANARTPAVYGARLARWRASLERLSNVATVELAVEGRLLVGVGNETVAEVGLTLRHVDGTPYIPGSALKGLARHYAERQLAQGGSAALLGAGSAYHQVLFGQQANAAHVTYFDAWFVPDPADDRPLQADVITVHHPTYYSSEGQKWAPWDLDDPNPVALLSARGTYLLAVRGPNAHWAKLALDILKQALSDWGIGAKTSSGYGRLKEPAALSGRGAEARRPDRVAQVSNVAPAVPSVHPRVAEVRAVPHAKVKPEMNPLYARALALDEPVRRQVLEEIRGRLAETGALRDAKWVEKRQWVRDLLRLLAETAGGD